MQEAEYLNALQLGAKLGISPYTVNYLARRGRIPSGIKIGKTRRWSSKAIDEWLQAKAQAAQDLEHEKERQDFTKQLLEGSR